MPVAFSPPLLVFFSMGGGAPQLGGVGGGGRTFRNVTSEIWKSVRRSETEKKGSHKGGREALGEEIYELFSEPEDT